MKKIYTVVSVFIAVLICSVNVFSQPGTLDPAFGIAGKAYTNFTGINNYGHSTAIQIDGKIVVAGYIYIGTNADFSIARFNTDGSPDLTFDGDGRQVTAIGSGDDIAKSVAIQTDGKIVVAGYSYTGFKYDFSLVRYNTNGSLDLTFDTDGKINTSIGPGSALDIAYAIAIQSDGKIVVGGTSYNGSNNDFALARYNTNGSLDLTFSADGKQTTAIGSFGDDAYALAIQTDGKIVLAGTSYNGTTNGFALARYSTVGVLDVTFDGDGKLITAVGTSYDVANSVVIQSDGKIVVAGTSNNGANNDFAVTRYTTTGVLDVSFDGDGKLTTAIGAGAEYAPSLRMQSDGKIVLAGTTAMGANNDFAVVRYSSNGSFDVSFDGDGKLTTDVGSNSDFANALVIQSDGKIVVAGQSDNGANGYFAVTRYTTAGVLDVSFDVDGKLTTLITSHDFAYAMAIQSDGKIIMGGRCFNGVKYNFSLARYNTNGSLDVSFDGDGKLTTAIGSSADYIFSIAIQSDGKIVAAGVSFNGTDFDFALARYNTNGSLDPTFSGDGKLTTAIGISYDFANAVAIQSDGKIVVAGSSSNGTYDDFALARYNTDGSPDLGFDVDGKLTTAIGSFNDFASSVLIQSDGKIIAAGGSTIGGYDDFALVRYNTNGSLDLSFDVDGKLTTDIGGSYDVINAMAIQSNGKIVVAGRSSNGSWHKFALARYNTNGSLDAGFDSDGSVVTALGGFNDIINSIAIQNDGKIVVAGTSFNGTDDDLALARYNIDGSLDAGFDSDGKVFMDLAPATSEYPSAMKMFSNRIYIGGFATIETGWDFVLLSVINDAFPLPLSLLSFNARLSNNNAVLNWKTTNEINSLSFDVERSTDGRNYTAVGNIAAFNTTGDHQYNFIDNNINSLGALVIYYRLKQKDINGGFKYSRIVALSINDSKSIVMFYPNPVIDEANLTLTVGKSENVKGRIIDNTGRVVKQQQWNLLAGSTSLPVDVKGLAKGIYYLELKGETINERKIFVKQ